MLRIILIALVIVLPIFYYLVYYLRVRFIDKDAKLFDYINLKIFSIILCVLFVCYMLVLAFRLQEFSGENIKPAVYQDGKIVK